MEPSQKQNYISYARLPHGKYTLRLHSTDGLNNYSDDTIIHFRILPPWYLTSWWYLVCTLLIIASFSPFSLDEETITSKESKADENKRN